MDKNKGNNKTDNNLRIFQNWSKTRILRLKNELDLNYFQKTLPPNTTTLKVRASTYKFGGSIIQSIADIWSIHFGKRKLNMEVKKNNGDQRNW